MSKIVLHFLCFLISAVLVNAQWTLDCANDKRMVVNFDDGRDFHVVYATSNEDGCAFVESGLGTLYTKVIDLNSDAVLCGIHTNTTVENRVVYSIDIIAREDPLILQATDKRFILSCEFGLDSVALTTSDVKAIELADDAFFFHSNNLPQSGIQLELNVVDAEDNQDTTSGVVGQNVYLMVTMPTNSEFQSLRVTECYVFESNQKTISPPVGLIKDTGCGYGSTMAADEGFVSLPFTNLGSSFKSPAFDLFKYRGYDKLYLECVVHLCSVWDDPRCPKESCQSKWPAGEDDYDGIQIVSKEISMHSFGQTDEQLSLTCQKPTSYLGLIITLAILALILLLLLAMALMFILKKRKRLRGRQEILQSIVNPFVQLEDLSDVPEQAAPAVPARPAFQTPSDATYDNPPLPPRAAPKTGRAATLGRPNRIITANNGMAMAPESQKKCLFEHMAPHDNGVMNEFQPSDQIDMPMGIYSTGFLTLQPGMSQSRFNRDFVSGSQTLGGTGPGYISDDSETSNALAASYIRSKPSRTDEFQFIY